MNVHITSFIALLTLGGAALSDEPLFEAKTYYHESGHLRYRLHSPAVQTGGKLPLVVYLHGAAKCGDNNQAQMGMAAVGQISGALNRHPAYVLVPQCPALHEGFALTNSRHSQGILGYGAFDRTTINEWVSFRLPIGRYLAGPRKYFTILTEANENNTEAMTFSMRGVQILDTRTGNAQAIQFSLQDMVGYPVVPRQGARALPSPQVGDGGAVLTLAANPGERKGLAMPLPLKIEPWMELVFEARTNAFNERGMNLVVGFDSDMEFDFDRWSLNWELNPNSPEARYGEQPNPPLLKLLALIKELREQLPNVDPDRIYIGGHSMGGFGTWEAILREPDLFAAALPTSGGGDPTSVARVANLPIWAGHAKGDNVVSSAWTERMVNALHAASATRLKVTWYDNKNHMIDSGFWGPEVIDWMFSQRRADKR
jgi:hypothetical protein